MNAYRAFGLTLFSDIVLPELLPIDFIGSASDVQIREVGRFSDFEADEDEVEPRFQLNVKNVADFLIKNGNQISYKRMEGVGEDTLRLFILGSCMGCVLQQRGFVVLHGNAFSSDGETCQIIVGHRGAGKSTAAAWHYRQGDKILADDVCAISLDAKGNPWVVPSFPQIKLWKTSADLLGIRTEGLRRIRADHEKFALPLGNQFLPSSLPLTEVIELDAGNKVVKPIEGMDKTRCLIEHSYRYHFLQKMNMTPQYMEKLIKMASLIRVRTGVRVLLGG